MKGLKERTIHGFVWSGVDRFLTQGITFVIGLLVARLLTPQDYGLVAMLTLFISISNTFVDCGFSSALIRKANRTGQDESTVFYTNTGIGIVAYLILFLTAPLIAAYYHQPQLTAIARVIGVSLLFNAISVVQQAILVSRIDFKMQTRISVITNVLAGGVGLIMAYSGMGVWSLVVQALLVSILKSLLLWIFVRWVPRYGFSTASFGELFAFGSRILLSGLLDTGYKNLYLLLIGKYYTASSLGYYSRASQVAQFPALNLTEIMQRVSLPALSAIQEDTQRQAMAYRKMLVVAAYITFPVMIWLAVVAKPLIEIVLTPKWSEAAVLLQILSFAMMWYPIHAINLNLLQVKGRSDWFLKLEVIKKILGVSVLLITLHFGVIAMCWGMVVTSVVALVINTHYTGRLIGLGLWAQMKDIMPVLIRSLITGLCMFFIVQFIDNQYLQVFLTLGLGALVYILISPKTSKTLFVEFKQMTGKVQSNIPQDYD